MAKLKGCPFCGGEAYIRSNRDWHRLHVQHAGECALDSLNEIMMVSASDENEKWIVDLWNMRAKE